MDIYGQYMPDTWHLLPGKTQQLITLVDDSWLKTLSAARIRAFVEPEEPATQDWNRNNPEPCHHLDISIQSIHI